MESLESHTLNAFSKNIELTDHQKAVLKQIDAFSRQHLKERTRIMMSWMMQRDGKTAKRRRQM